MLLSSPVSRSLGQPFSAYGQGSRRRCFASKVASQAATRSAAQAESTIPPIRMRGADAGAVRATDAPAATSSATPPVASPSSSLAARIAAKAAISLSDSARTRLEEIVEAEGPGDLILSLQTKGCNGFAYVMEVVPHGERRDDLVRAERVEVTPQLTLFIHPQALLAVLGTHMDFVETELGAEFVFDNPNASATCGCGESFSL